MTTEEALLAAIWASPHDDLPRLVYADWLDEQGDPAKVARAEFIRVQCELARVGEYDDRRKSLEGVETALLGMWGESFRPYLPGETTGVRYDRGFVLPNIRIGMKRLRSRGPNFLANAPLWAFEFCLQDGGAEFPLLAQTDRLRRAARLQFCSCRHQQPDEYGVWLAASECFVNLTHIHLGTALDVPAPTDQFREFCRAENFPQLRGLSLSGEGLTGELVPHLIDAPFAFGLHTLSVSAPIRLSPSGFAKFVSATAFDNLQQLYIWGVGEHWRPEEYLRVFAHQARFRRLKQLSLSINVSESEWIELFRRWPGATGLQDLNLGRCTELVVRNVIAAGVFPNLRRLSLSIPGYSTSAQLVTSTNDIIVPGATPGDQTTELIRFALDHGVSLIL